jgi:DNA-binding response OmpR family regulator
LEAVLISPFTDEASILRVLLHQAGFRTNSLSDMHQAIETWPSNPADLVLIVIPADHSEILPQIKLLRGHAVVPLLIISDPLSDESHVNFLDAGVDLVVIKPYSVRTLLAQIRALMRRGSGLPFFSLPSLTQKDVTLDPSNRTVQVGELEPKRLTQLEFRLLYTLMIHVGQIIPTEQIVEQVWGYTGEGNRELVRGLVQRVRSKIEPDPRNPEYILTEVGIGYYFTS